MISEPREPTVHASTASTSPYDLSVSQRNLGSPLTGPVDRDHLLDRIAHLRGILPVFAQELATSRRQAAALRIENRKLSEEVRRLRRQNVQSTHHSRR